MPTTSLVCRRIHRIAPRVQAQSSRTYNNGPNSERFSARTKWLKDRRGTEERERNKSEHAKDVPKSVKDGGRVVGSNGRSNKASTVTAKPKEPSLFEQLFPDQQLSSTGEQEQEVPHIPPNLPGRDARPTVDETANRTDAGPRKDFYQRQIEKEEARVGPQISVLILLNRSKNLVEEDFKRLVPKGKHTVGWTLEEGNILQVIPSRNWHTLEHDGTYYVLFSSALSAFAYQGHATRVHQLVSQQTPSNVLSPILPPPGYMVQGLDANDAIESFTLAAPNQPLMLRQLKPPLSPLVQTIVGNRGYPHMLKRADRLPYEVRLTLDGPQLHLSAIRHIFLMSGKDRGLSWSGIEDHGAPRISEWDPARYVRAPGPANFGLQANKWALSPERIRAGKDDDDDEGTSSSEGHLGDQKQRTSQRIFILGFYTENAMQSFVRFWHRRPLQWEGLETFTAEGEDGDLPPIVHAEVLW